VSLQPNSGAQGEYRAARRSAHSQASGAARKETRNICLIPQSRTARTRLAVLGGMKVVVVATRRRHESILVDLRKKAEEHAKDLAAVIVTYP